MGLFSRPASSGDIGGEDNREHSARKARQFKAMSPDERRSVLRVDRELLKGAEEAERAGDMRRAQELRRQVGD
jgi:hypothetical protein